MPELNIAPFISTEPDVEVDDETSRIMVERVKVVDQGHLVSSLQARERILYYHLELIAAFPEVGSYSRPQER